MKLTSTHITKRKSGMTLLELTVVILVLLSLISILFIGARAWKKGSDRAACILNIRNVQQAVRSHQNMYALTTEDPITWTDIVSDDGDKYLKTPSCPSNGDYTQVETFPELGSLAMTCSLAGDDDHVPTEHSDW